MYVCFPFSPTTHTLTRTINHHQFPLLDETYGFALFWVFTALAVAGILWFFWLKGWWAIG